jgi:PGF-pre-PGF domain-containing protein
VTCTGTDAAGNSATKDTTYTVTSSGGGSSGGGGSGGGVSSSGGVFKKTWVSILAGETATVETKDPSYGVSKVEFKVADAIYGVSMEVKVASEATLPVSKYGKKVNKYIEIVTTNVKGVTDATISLKVLKSWLVSNNLKKADIIMVRFIENSKMWQQLDTSIEKEDDTYVYYTAKTPGFSFFAIAGADKQAAPEAPAAEEGAAVPEGATPEEVAPEAPAEEAAEEEAPAEGTKVPTAVWVAAGVGVLVVAGYYLFSRRKKKN